MRVLHTADWHMNDSLGRVDRTDDIRAALQRIAGYLEEHQVDVMVVAGDLFSDRSRPEQMRSAIGTLRETFVPFLSRGGTILAISGNHDSEVFFETLRDALELVAPQGPGSNGRSTRGRLYLAPRAARVVLVDSREQPVQFVLMPYPTPRCYLHGTGSAAYTSLEKKHEALLTEFAGTLKALEARVDPHNPAVLVSHIYVRGAHARAAYRLSELEDVVFEASAIPTHWSYVAYGHIHRAQPAVEGAKHVQYCGSIERMDLGERDDCKGVWIFDVGAGGLQGDPTFLPLDATPVYQVEITRPEEEIPALRDRYPDADRALVSYVLHWQPGKQDREALCRQIQQCFPRWYQREFVEVGREQTRIAGVDPSRRQDVAGTVRDYLQVALASYPAQDREDLNRLAEALLVERSES